MESADLASICVPAPLKLPTDLQRIGRTGGHQEPYPFVLELTPMGGIARSLVAPGSSLHYSEIERPYQLISARAEVFSQSRFVNSCATAANNRDPTDLTPCSV